MALSTANVTVGSGKLRKNIEPGNRYVKINNITMEKPKWQGAHESERFIYLDVETEPIDGDFEGFYRDPNNPELGRYSGQIGKVASSKYTYKDYETQDGTFLNMTDQVMKFLAGFCKELDITDWWLSIDGKFDTLEDIVFALNEHKPFKDKYIHMCVAGKEWEKDGYINHNLYLPKYNRTAGPAFSMDEELVCKFTITDHIDKLKNKKAEQTVSSFGGVTPAADQSAPSAAGSPTPFSMKD